MQFVKMVDLPWSQRFFLSRERAAKRREEKNLWSAYHLNEILGENFSTIGTACSVLRKRKWECAVSFARKTGCSS